MTSWWTQPISLHFPTLLTTGCTVYQKAATLYLRREKVRQQFHINPWPHEFGSVNELILERQAFSGRNSFIPRDIITSDFPLVFAQTTLVRLVLLFPLSHDRGYLWKTHFSPPHRAAEPMRRLIITIKTGACDEASLIIYTFLTNTLSSNLLQTLLSCETVGL